MPKLRDARGTDSALSIAFFPKPRSGGQRRGGAWKEGDFSFRGVFKKKKSEEDVADKFGLGDVGNSASSRWRSGVKADSEKEGRPFFKLMKPLSELDGS